MLFSSKKSVLGVDIGSDNIKIAQVTTKDNAHILDTYGIVNFSFKADDQSEESITATASVLKNLVEKSEATTRKIVASLPSSTVFTSVIEMPRMSDSELKNAVEYEAKKYVPLQMSDLTLSWVVSEKTPDDKSMVLITAVPNAVLRRYLKIFELAKLEPVALEIEALALIRSIVGPDKGSNLLIDVGANSSHLNIIEHGNLVLARNVPIGGQTITSKIAEGLKISADRAEQFKKDFGINQAGMIPETIKPVLQAMKTEAKQLQSIYQARGKKFDRILLAGGGANLPGFADFFGDLGPKIVIGDPLFQLQYDPNLKPLLQQYAGSLAVAIGLALRSSDK